MIRYCVFVGMRISDVLDVLGVVAGAGRLGAKLEERVFTNHADHAVESQATAASRRSRKYLPIAVP